MLGLSRKELRFSSKNSVVFDAMQLSEDTMDLIDHLFCGVKFHLFLAMIRIKSANKVDGVIWIFIGLCIFMNHPTLRCIMFIPNGTF